MRKKPLCKSKGCNFQNFSWRYSPFFISGAREGTRTPMDEPPDPKSGASTNFATRACLDIITRLLIFDKNVRNRLWRPALENDFAERTEHTLEIRRRERGIRQRSIPLILCNKKARRDTYYIRKNKSRKNDRVKLCQGKVLLIFFSWTC